MGKGTISGGGPAGLYQVQVMYDRTRAEATIAALQARIGAIDARLTALVTEIAAAETAKDYAYDVWQAKIAALAAVQNGADLEEEQATLEALIADANADEEVTPTEQRAIDRQQAIVDALQADLEAAQKALKQTQTDHDKAAAALTALLTEQRTLKLSKMSAEKRIQFLQANLPADQIVAAWCADYNETLSGVVGLIETGLAEGPAYLIRPGGVSGDQANYVAATDGALTPIMAMTPASAFLNYALLPGQAKWKPRYRFGTITAVYSGTDTADIQLQAAPSTHQQLDINQTAALSGVPILYMDCNAAAFNPGDEVVVGFLGADWGQSQIIGFKSNPKPCTKTPYIFIPSLPYFDETVGWWWQLDYHDGYQLIEGTLSQADADIPGHLIDMRDGSVVIMRHPETGAVLDDVVREDLGELKIKWKGLSKQSISAILGLTFVEFGGEYKGCGLEGWIDSPVGSTKPPEDYPQGESWVGEEFSMPAGSAVRTGTWVSADEYYFDYDFPQADIYYDKLDDDGNDIGGGQIPSMATASGSIDFDGTPELVIDWTYVWNYVKDSPYYISKELSLRGEVFATASGSDSVSVQYSSPPGSSGTGSKSQSPAAACSGLGASESVSGQVTSDDAYYNSEEPQGVEVMAQPSFGRYLDRAVYINQAYTAKYYDPGQGITTYTGGATLVLLTDAPMTFGTDKTKTDSYDTLRGTRVQVTTETLAGMMGLTVDDIIERLLPMNVSGSVLFAE